jgi:nucleotide-binding universal stress UspA family protein
MSTIRSVLAASDFSVDAAGAAHRAALLAGEHGATLQLLHVVGSDLLSELRERLRISDDVQQLLLADARRSLDALANDVQRAAHTTPERFVRTGDVLEEILAAADHADVLVLGAHGMRPVRDLLIGTTAERLLRKSRRPMLVSKQEPSTSYRRVLVPVDFSTHSIATLRFAHQVAPNAALLVFHAYECPYETKLRQANVSDRIIKQFHIDSRDRALSNMENLRDKAAAPVARTAFSVDCGVAKTSIAAKAADYGADLIVLGKHGLSFVDELFLGGVTRHTLARATCDVAVVPDWPRL